MITLIYICHVCKYVMIIIYTQVRALVGKQIQYNVEQYNI